MAIDPRLSLEVRGPRDINQVFQNALLNAQRFQNVQQTREQAPLRNRLLQAQTGQAEATLTREQQLNRFRSVAFGATEILPDLASGNFAGANQKLQARRAQLIRDNLPTAETDNAIRLLQEDPDTLLGQVRQIIQVGEQQGLLKPAVGAGGLASAKTEIFDDGTVIQSLPDKTVQVTNPAGQIVTGQERLDTLQRSSQFRLGIQEKEADIAVRKAQEIATATQRASRVSSITKELSTRNRNAARESIKLNQALNVAGTAEQGLTGSVKLRLAKLVPGIDVTNEALLAQSLKSLALDQLQNFKGPTTDFEFGVTEDIAGKLGDPRTANIARIKSLQRAAWFNQREFKQFQKHIKAGKDPDTFGFNFGEQIKTKRGEFSLQDIQDTAVENNLSIEETIKRLNQ